jgi:hypothetical protein
MKIVLVLKNNTIPAIEPTSMPIGLAEKHVQPRRGWALLCARPR